MARTKVQFNNKQNEKLEGILELPDNQKAHNFIVFAHCFTCTKNLIAVANICAALTEAGFGVLRFDFTGLGESEGNFSETNFSGNVEDLIAAADFLEKDYRAPSILVGHSLGGTACIFAGDKLPSVKAVAVIGSPSDPQHVAHLIKNREDEIIKTGKAIVNIGGRDFTIKKQFLDDLKNKPIQNILRDWKKSLLILHSPQDRIVGIDNAEEIFKAAWHPKSFVSLDGADHLMSNRDDSAYVGQVIASWVTRYIDMPSIKATDSKAAVTVSLDHEDMFTTYVTSGNHRLIADEPVKVGGHDFGPTPYDYVAIGLAACTAMTMHMYARRKGWKLENTVIHVDHSNLHATDCKNCNDPNSRIHKFEKKIKMTGELDKEQHHRLMEIADRCPVHRTLLGSIEINSSEIE